MWIFEPILKHTIWGGSNIATLKENIYNHTNTQNNDKIGESWEISAVENNISIVAEGPQKGWTITKLIQTYKDKIIGKQNYNKFGTRFPLLIKFIDAEKDLSIQVHPNNEMAAKLHNTMGKTEMWFVIDAKKNARICCGFNQKITSQQYNEMIQNGSINSILNFLNIHKGQTYYIPSGRIHTIGAGSFLAEIQQTSDITYRVFDYNRKDSNGKLRELHTDLALEAINFNDTNPQPLDYDTKSKNTPVELLKSPYFDTQLITVTQSTSLNHTDLDSFIILIITEGECIISHDGELQPSPELTSTRKVKAGTTILIPATTTNINIQPLKKTIILQTYVK